MNEAGNFALDGFAVLIAISFVVLCLWVFRPRSKNTPSFFFSSLSQPNLRLLSKRLRFAFLPQFFSYTALVFFLLAFLDPHLLIRKKNENLPSLEQSAPKESEESLVVPTEGAAIFILADQSGSMKEYAEITSPQGEKAFIKKIDLLKNVTKKFIAGDLSQGLPGRTNDLIGLVAFARVAHILSPLTLDHTALLDQLSQLEVVSDPNQDGTSIGYAIFKTVNLITATKHFGEELQAQGKPAYTINNSVIIVVTDGFQYPSPLDKGNRLRNIDLDEAAAYAKAHDIKVYLVNIDPSILDPQYEPQRHQMKRITELTGGKFYRMDSKTDLTDIYAEIDRLEKNEIMTEAKVEQHPEKEKESFLQHYRKASFSPYLIAAGMLCMFLAIVLETTALKRIP